MTDGARFLLDGVEVPFRAGQTIIEAADDAGLYIPRLCHLPGLVPYGGCRVCSVRANGRMVASCVHPAGADMVVESDTEELNQHRRLLLEMLFVSGNHFCPICERSGNCELQALGYRFGIAAPLLEFQYPKREVDASHPDILIDHNRCILCGRCVRASRDLDHKEIFGFVGRGVHRRLAVASGTRLGDTACEVTDRALDACPVGALLRKRVGFTVPVGRRRFDRQVIGAEIASREGAP